MKLTFRKVREILQRRYKLDAITAGQTASLFMKDDIPNNKIHTEEELISYLKYAEELGGTK